MDLAYGAADELADLGGDRSFAAELRPADHDAVVERTGMPSWAR